MRTSPPRRPPAGRAPHLPAVALALLLALVLAALPAAAQDEDPGSGGDAPPAAAGDLLVLSSDQQGRPTDGIDLAVRLSQLDHAAGGVPRVLLASAASFADALAASVGTADAPLLLTPPDGLPAVVEAELLRLAPAEVVLLGGPAALSEAVEADVAALDLVPTRLAGPSRIETAIAVSRAFADPQADGAVVVRAFAQPGGDPSAAWADSVTAGALAAQLGWPILLTETEQLSPPVEAELARRQVEEVVVVGGEAAVSGRAFSQVLGTGGRAVRIAGRDRAETAVALSQARGALGRVVLVEGTGDMGWQAGIAASGHAVRTGAALLPTGADGLPPVVAEAIAASQPTAFTCAVTRAVCEAGRSLAGLDPLPVVTYNPMPGSAVAPDELLRVAADDPDRRLPGEASVESECPVDGIDYLPEAAATFRLGTTTTEEPGGDQGGGPITGQPDPGTGDAGGPAQEVPVQAPEPLDPDEPAPAAQPLLPCVVTTTFARADGSALVDVATFFVIDPRPRIRVTSFPQVEDEPITFLDRSDRLVDAWRWDFGDGSAASAAQHPTHTYSRAYCYDVALTVTSPFAHWLTGSAFQETEVRTVSVDPSGSSSPVGVVLVDDGERVPGEVLRAFGPGGAEVVRTTGPDGRADFGSLAPGDWVIAPDLDPAQPLELRVVAGHTHCPTLVLGAAGTIQVEVLDGSGEDALPVQGATVRITDAAGQVVGQGLTDSSGGFTSDELMEGTYRVAVTYPGSGRTVTAPDVPVSPAEATTVEVTPSGATVLVGG